MQSVPATWGRRRFAGVAGPWEFTFRALDLLTRSRTALAIRREATMLTCELVPGMLTWPNVEAASVESPLEVFPCCAAGSNHTWSSDLVTKIQTPFDPRAVHAPISTHASISCSALAAPRSFTLKLNHNSIPELSGGEPSVLHGMHFDAI